jgi:hypothetical protein
MGSDIQQAPLRDCSGSGVESHGKSIAARNGRSSDVHTPLAAHHAEEVVDDWTVTRELGSALTNELHAIDPHLFRFRDRRPLSPDLAKVLNELRDITLRRRTARSGRLRLCSTRRPLPTTLRSRVAAGVMHEYP